MNASMKNSTLKKQWLVFIAGFFAVLCFHQPVAGLLHAYEVIPFAPYATAAVPPLSVPSWFSASFWGGIWALLMVALFARPGAQGLWWKMALFGGVMLTLVALLIVFPLKGRGLNLALFPIGFLLNAAWGLGTWIFLRALAVYT